MLLAVYEAQTGERVQSIFTEMGMMAGGMTYLVDGEQYVAIMAGYGGVLLSVVHEVAAASKYVNDGRSLPPNLGALLLPSRRKE